VQAERDFSLYNRIWTKPRASLKHNTALKFAMVSQNMHLLPSTSGSAEGADDSASSADDE
jgi:hypothetical protein